MELTKNLYFKDDVMWSIIDSLINKRNEETIFWISEYYESGFKTDMWKLIYVLYSCFYSKHYLYFKEKIDKNYKNWLNKPDIKTVLKIINQMMNFNNYKGVDFDLYKIFSNQTIRKVKLTTKITKEIYDRVSIKKKDLHNNYVKSLVENHYENIWFYICKLSFKKTKLITEEYYETKFSIVNEVVNDKKVQLFLLIFNMNKKSKGVLFKLPQKMVDIYNNFQLKENIIPFNILKTQRKYKVPSGISQYNCERFNYANEELQDMYFNWEYNTRNTPYWKEIYEKNNVTFNNYKPQFLNDEEEEKFYEEYNLEPDEQSNEIHEKSMM